MTRSIGIITALTGGPALVEVLYLIEHGSGGKVATASLRIRGWWIPHDTRPPATRARCPLRADTGGEHRSFIRHP